MSTYREFLEDRLAESRAAAERLKPLQTDQALAGQEQQILDDIKKVEQREQLETVYAAHRAKAQALLDEAKPAVVEYRRRFDAVVQELQALCAEAEQVQAPIWEAANEAKRAARAARQIGELGGTPVGLEGDLGRMWDEIGGCDPQLAAMPLLATLPHTIGEPIRALFRYGRHYLPELGAKNFTR